MKKSIQLLGSLMVILLMALTGCSAPTDHVGLWKAVEQNGKALAEGNSIEYMFTADNIASLSDVVNGRLDLYAYEVERSGNELSLTGIGNDNKTFQVTVSNNEGKELMTLTSADETLVLEKQPESTPAITDAKYRYLYFPVTVIDDESGARMSLRFFCNGKMMFDSYIMSYAFNPETATFDISSQAVAGFQVKITSDTEWQLGMGGQFAARQVIVTKK